MKFCPQCQMLKPLSEFSPRSGARSHQLRSWCKCCNVSKTKTARLLDIEKARERDRGYARQRALCDPQGIRDNAARTREKNREAIRIRQRDWAAKNPEYNLQWAREAYHSDEDYRLAVNLRGRIRHAILDAGAKKSANTEELMGCSRFWFQLHMATLFKPGMTWENHGEVWEIDHIRPCASFNLTDPVEQRRCFHWMNTQPLFVSENRRKSAYYNASLRQSSKETGSACCQPASFR